MKKTQDLRIPCQEQLQAVVGCVDALYPDRFKARHRVILTLAGDDYVLDGFLSVNRPKRELKLMAQNDLGGIVFDVHYIENLKQQIQNNLKSIKNVWLENSLLRDLTTLYLLKSLPSDQLFKDDNNDLILSQKQDGFIQELIFRPFKDRADCRLHEIRRMKNKKIVYRVNFEYGTKGRVSYPEFIFIEDKKMRYRLKVNVQYFL